MPNTPSQKPGRRKENDFRNGLKKTGHPKDDPGREERGNGRKCETSRNTPDLRHAAPGDRHPLGPRAIQTVYERIGSPAGLPKADDIPDGMMGSVVKEMHRRFNGSGIHLGTLSPNVSPRELYEFMTGEFMRVEIAAFDTPVMHCFVYDAFRPDPWHGNERRALEYCIRILLQKENRLHMFPNGRPITINGHRELSESEFRRIMHAFRSSHSDIVSLHAEALRTTVKDDHCIVRGRHVTGLCSEAACRIAKGDWQVEFLLEEDMWLVRSVNIEGIGL